MPEPIRSPRLDLVELSAELLVWIAEENLDAIEDTLGVTVSPAWLPTVPAKTNYKLLREDPANRPWLSRGIVLRAERALIGEVGFHSAPDELAVVELSYEVLPGYRRRGIAAEAVLALTDWAYETGEAGTAYATIEAGNTASIGLVRSLGFLRGELYEEPGIQFYESGLPLRR
ncbi:GNAT family N-acetyltransferase [Amycolatopsis acidicola]|uniref:GNAT family N-acetyltransferase n=1 Tax=Amycolatopsis acidicola TaxID=2596893 RepID=A0A5N0VIC4_9PSEU|nr:GNAT family N-acetyltransferase [Amycolatopsis acidicola]KAA9166099.1 GNAT family N-acetyltransferase [Amycolatopsis acidicola]